MNTEAKPVNTNKKIFSITCQVTGKSKLVSQDVWQKRVTRAQKVLRSRNHGKAPTKDETVKHLLANYVSLEGRRQNGVDFLNTKIEPKAKVVKITKKAATPKAKKVATPKVAKPAAPVATTTEIPELDRLAAIRESAARTEGVAVA